MKDYDVAREYILVKEVLPSDRTSSGLVIVRTDTEKARAVRFVDVMTNEYVYSAMMHFVFLDEPYAVIHKDNVMARAPYEGCIACSGNCDSCDCEQDCKG